MAHDGHGCGCEAGAICSFMFPGSGDSIALQVSGGEIVIGSVLSRMTCWRKYRVYRIFVALLLILPSAAMAADPLLDEPRWSLEVKGGLFYPELPNWETYYGEDRTSHYAGSLAYKLFRQIELGIEAGYIKDRGTGHAPLHGITSGRVTYELAPVSAFVLLRGVFNEQQWLIPYIGGGATRLYYRAKIEFQEIIRGAANGYYGRAGIQLLLDGVDPSAANSFYLDYGVFHTYFFVEAQRINAATKTSSIELGGTSYLAGLLFEF